MDTDSKIDDALQRIAADSRTNVWHICLYTALLHYWCKSGFQPFFHISRREVMTFAHFGSIATYHKCIRQLLSFGYIKYLPSYNPFIGSTISLS